MSLEIGVFIDLNELDSVHCSYCPGWPLPWLATLSNSCLTRSLPNLSHIQLNHYIALDIYIGQQLFMNPAVTSTDCLLDLNLFGPNQSGLFPSFSFLGYLRARYLRV